MRDIRAAEELWRAAPPRMHKAAVPAFAMGLFVVVAASTGCWALHVRDSDRPGRTFVLMAIGPTLLALYAALEMLAYWSPFARLQARFAAVKDPRYPELVLCRGCGASLNIEPTAFAAHCAYCGRESLVRSPRIAPFRRVRDVGGEGRALLADAISNIRTLREQRTVVRVVGLGMTTMIFAILTAALWNQ